MTATRLGIALLVALVATSAVGGAAILATPGGVASAGHGEADADYTVEPQESADREPGGTNAQYGQIVVAEAGVDFETLERMEAVYEEGSWSNCGQGDADEFGIDRGNTHDGYETDESLEENVKRFSAGEDVFEVEFNGEDDIGTSTHLDDGDAIVSLATCIENPDEPGWYQISGSSTGVTEDGEEVTISGESHYFWICECEDEEEAREELGPPPSEDGDTGEADDDGEQADDGDRGSDEEEEEEDGEETSDGDDENGQDDDGESDDGGENDESDVADEDGSEDGEDGSSDGADSEADGEADESEDGDAAAHGDEATENGSDEHWDQHRVETPTPGDGPGFGPVAAIVALLGSASLLVRRS